ncbi:sulfatase-like hydrolase/transferase [Candidatus Binatia bacterium]|nr:sulfatase-like hydrolase/transferase [Candidatus Binatia bacterium]
MRPVHGYRPARPACAAMMLRPNPRLGAVLLALLAAACAPDSTPLDVAVRLGPARFGRAPATQRPAVLQIGDEARPVLDAPAITLLAQRRAVLIRDRLARFTVQLAAEARELPDDAFQLSVKHVRPRPPGTAAAAADEIELGAEAIHFVRRDAGWRLLRPADDPSRVTIEVDEPAAAADETLEVQIEAVGRTAARLESDRFVVPPRARLLLGFALARPPREAGESTFTALLSCDDRDDVVVLAQRLAAPEQLEPRWYDASTDVPHAGTTCRLRLDVEGAAARAGTGVWSVPLVLGRMPPDGPSRPNLVVISLDTLRADHLSAYGYPRPTSPRIDAMLAARGTLFTDVSTTFPLTSPAHMSLMTGLSAAVLTRPGVLDAATPATVLAEALRDAGYVTGAYTEDALLAGMFGFWFGFDRFVERPLAGEARGTETFLDGARFLRANRGRRFFLFLHTYKVHAPYVSSPAYARFAPADDWSGPLAERGVPPEQRPFVDAYDRAIREADDQVADLLREIDRLGLAEDTLVVLLSDHGEAFGEHGLVGHGFGGHQEQLHIPLVLRGPGIPAGRREPTPSGIVDVLPTVLDVLRLPPLDVQGRSLRAVLDGAAGNQRALPFQWIEPGARGLRRGSVKLLETAAGPPQLFDLARDPAERVPLDDATLRAAEQAALAAATHDDEQRRDALNAPHVAGAPAQGGVASERMMESLRSLGYVQ